MRTTMGLSFNVIAMGVAALFIAGTAHVSAQQAVDGAIRIGGSDLGGVVTACPGDHPEKVEGVARPTSVAVVPRKRESLAPELLCGV